MAKKVVFEKVPLDKTIPNLLEILDPISTVQWIFMETDPQSQKFIGKAYVELWSDTEAEIVIDKWNNQTWDSETPLEVRLLNDKDKSPEMAEDKEVVLNAAANYIYSVIRFQVNAPPGSVVYVNDFPKVQVDEMGNGVVRSLLPGKYNIKVGFQEYLLAEENISVNADEEPPRLKVSMDASVTQAMGAISASMEGTYSTIEMISASGGPVTVTTKATPLLPLNTNTTTTKATTRVAPAVGAAQLNTLFVEKVNIGAGQVEVIGTKAKKSSSKALVAIASVVILFIVAGIIVLPRILKSNTNAATDKPIVKEVPPPPAPDGMVYIPGGTVIIGRNNTDDDYQKPVHEKLIQKGYYLDKTEVTNEDYWGFIQDTKKEPPKTWAGPKPPNELLQLPVIVNWADAMAFCHWRGTRKSMVYRLPTEVEWEHAARGEKNYVYPWGNDWLEGYANVNKVNNKIMPVGSNSKDVSPYGVLDMAGNVREWTKDDFLLYPGGKGKVEPNTKAIRGAAYSDSPEAATTTYRGYLAPAYEKIDRTGFRCLCEVPETDSDTQEAKK